MVTRKFVVLVVVSILLGMYAYGHDLTVEIAGARSDGGDLIICLWSESERRDFPNCSSGTAFQSEIVRVSSGGGTVTFLGVPEGRYAVSAVHDEDGDGRVTRGKEGVALSRIDRLGFPPPGFRRAAFDVIEDQTIVLTLHYFRE